MDRKGVAKVTFVLVPLTFLTMFFGAMYALEGPLFVLVFMGITVLVGLLASAFVWAVTELNR